MKKMIIFTTSSIILYLITFSTCLKINLKRNITPEYNENYAQFAASLYSPSQENESAVVSEEKIDEDASKLDLNYDGLTNENFLETSNKEKSPVQNPISSKLNNDLKTKNESKFFKDVLSTINLKDNLNSSNTAKVTQTK